jgi:ParB family transcriptional regulator, chromosome partitioning protein
METQVINATEYRNVSLSLLNVSKTNPRRTFEDAALKELADFVPGHKIGVLFRRPFCCRGRGEPHGNRRFPLVIGT